METNRYQRVKEVFGAVVDAPTDVRTALLHEQCGEDTALYREVQALLEHVDAPKVNIEKAAAAAQATISSLAAKSRRASMHAALARPGDMFGAYRTLGVLGEGGMGIVYLAEQDRPRRTVALKVVKPGYLSAGMLRRFEHETQVLGRLQHPGIAQIFEAGTADAGAGAQPYFAMEYVKGRPLLDYANGVNLGTRQRLELLIRICEAVHHAHLQGVIHRDLKPANILVVEEDPQAGGLKPVCQPKILDFGIARSTDADIHTTTLRTDIGQLIGTIPYMSPEQVAGDPARLDARSDIYALGVIGYELLAGRLPHDLRGKTIPEAVRMIGESDPTPLSSINKFFRGDLDTIVSKALERDPDRRYTTAADLAADIKRYLDDHPIVARPPTVLYQLTKFAKRNRAAVTALGAVFLMLIVSIIAVSIYAVQATIARDNAQRLQRSESAAHELAIANARRLAEQLTVSNIERGRLQGLAGNIGQAEELLWSEYLRTPNSLATHWALWELYSREPCVLTRQAHDKFIHGAVISADNTTLVTAAEDGLVRVWGLPSMELRREIVAHAKPIFAVALADDLDTIISGGDDGFVRFWSIRTGQMLREIAMPEKTLVRALAIAPDQSVIAAGCSDGLVRVWDLADGRPRAELTGLRGTVQCLRFDHDSRQLLATSSDGSMGLWRDWQTSTIAEAMKAHAASATSLAISADGGTIATGGNDHLVKLWDAKSLELIDTLRAPNGYIRFVEFSPDGRSLFTGGWWHIDQWDVATRTRLTPIATSTAAACGVMSPDGHLLVAGFDTGLIRMWDMQRDRGAMRLAGHSERVAAMFSPDGKTLATGDNVGALRLWDAESGSLLREIKAHNDRIRPMVFHPTLPLLFTGALDGFLRVWNLETGEMVKEISGHNAGSGGAIDISPDGTQFIHSRRYTSAALCSWPDLKEIHILKTPGGEALSAQFSPDGRMIAFTARGDYASLWSVETGRPLVTLPSSSMVWTTAFDPEGVALYGGIWTKEIFKWDLRNVPDSSSSALAESKATQPAATDPAASPRADPPIEFAGHNGLVSDVQTRPGDPRMLASASTDGTVKLWDTTTGICLTTLVPFGGWETINVCFTPDGRRLAVTGSNGEVVIYDLHYYDAFIAGNREYQQKRADARAR